MLYNNEMSILGDLFDRVIIKKPGNEQNLGDITIRKRHDTFITRDDLSDVSQSEIARLSAGLSPPSEPGGYLLLNEIRHRSGILVRGYPPDSGHQNSRSRYNAQNRDVLCADDADS